MNNQKGLCVHGLGLFINWGMAITAITVYGQNTPAARTAAEKSKREFYKHREGCPVCKPITLEESTNE